nr:uncharacterized protein LOC112293828 isoform X2 [Physcomitrium patens]|eukprot:XP_024399474.1 uncharacterized protein LOC112293828 isoform X2 [Physcomitrella patens]
MWHFCMELTEQRSHTLLGVPHHVAPWEQHWNGGDPVKQVRSAPRDKIMDSKLRIVQCPKCRAYLQEPPVGNPFYECGSCFATLQANHATQEDVDNRLRMKAQLKRLESEKNTKSLPPEDGCKVFTSESSSEKSIDREEHGQFGEGSPSRSPSRRESPLRGPISGHAPLPQAQPEHQRQAVESIDQPHYYPQNAVSRSKLDGPQEKVEALSYNLNQLGVEDSSEVKSQNLDTSGAEGANGHGAHLRSTRRPRSGELQPDRVVEGYHPQIRKSVSFKDPASTHSLGGDQTSISKDVHQVNRIPPPEPEDSIEDHIHHILDDFLSARYDAKPQYSKVEGYEMQREIHGASEISEYGTSSRTSSVGDGDAHHAMVVESHSRPKSGELDSYVVLDHRVTRPGSYQRSSSASRYSHLNSVHHHATDGHERYHSDGEVFLPHTHSASKMQHRSTAYQAHQPSHVPYQSSAQSPPHYSFNKPPAGQTQYLSPDSSVTNGSPKTYPFLPRPDEAPVVHCQHCEQLLSVPSNLPPTKKGYQKLRCGACFKISVFLVALEEHISAPTISPKGHVPSADFSTAHALHVTNSPDSGFSSRHINHGAKSDSETGDKGHASVVSGGSPRLPPVVRNIPRIPSGSKLMAMTSATNGTTMTGHAAVSNLHSGTGALMGRSNSSSHYSDGTTYRRSHSAYGPNGEHVMSSLGPRSDYEGHHPHDGRFFQTSSESDNDSPRQRPPISSFKGEQFYASSRMPLDRHVAQQYSKDEGYMQEANSTSSMSLKGIIKKGVKELTKPKENSSNNLYRRKVVVNGSPIPDALVKRAETMAGPIHPGSYWYDSQAGFWGLSGGPCLGIIPPHIEELSLQPLSRYCSGGQTGVLVNGRELHKSDYDLLVRRGLPPTPGKTYFIDIEGHVKEAVSGLELRGLGSFAPTYAIAVPFHPSWIKQLEGKECGFLGAVKYIVWFLGYMETLHRGHG